MTRDRRKRRTLSRILSVAFFIAMLSIGFGHAIALAEEYQPLDWGAYSSSPDYWIEEDIYTQTFDPTYPDYVWKQKQDTIYGGTSYADVFSIVDSTEEDAESLEIRAYQEGGSTLVASQTLTVSIPVPKGFNSLFDELKSFQTPDLSSVKWDSGIFELEPARGYIKANGRFQSSYHEKAPCVYTAYRGDVSLQYWTRLNSLAQKEGDNYEAFVMYKGCSSSEQYERYLNEYDLEERVDGARHVFIWSSKKNGVETTQSQTDYTNSEGKTRHEPTTIEATTDIRQYYVIDELPEVPGYYLQTVIRIENNLKTCKTADGTYISPEGQILIDEINYMHDAIDSELIDELLAIRPTVTWGEPNSLKNDKPVQEHVTIDTDADDKPGETDNGWVIPAAIVGGIAVVGGAAALGLRGRRKDGSDSDSDSDDDQQEEPPSTFRMVLWKQCGDTLFVGGGAQTVGARIVEEKPNGGGTVNRDDLTARLSFGVTDNMKAELIGMRGSNKCINVEAVEAGPEGTDTTGVVAITFTGDGASFTNNVKFKIQELRLEFPDVALTFVAGQKQTFQLPFRFSKEILPERFNPEFDTRLTSPEAEKRFRDVHVVRTDDYPGCSFAVEMTECGEIGKDDAPGTIESFTCYVAAALPDGAGGQGRKLEGEFRFFRFFEGIRFTCEPLKCYMELVERQAPTDGLERIRQTAAAQAAELVPDDPNDPEAATRRAQLQADLEAQMTSDFYDRYLDEGNVVVSGRNVIHGASQLMAASLGSAAGMSVPGAEWQVEHAIRETAREAKEMFPQLFERTETYLLATRDRMEKTPGRTHAYLTLYVVDEFTDEEGNTYRRPCTKLPDPGDISFSFTDVKGSSALHDEKGKVIENPAEALDFQYYIKDVNPVDNTVMFEIVPTKAIMVPPNRTLVDVGLVVSWVDGAGNVRAFSAEQRVNAISQPLRIDYAERQDQYDAEDADVKKLLLAIQETIRERPNGELAVAGSVSAAETVADVTEGMIDHPVLALNPVTAAGLNLYTAYKSMRRQLSHNIYYEDLMPLHDFIQVMLDGYDEHYGYCMSDVKAVERALARFENGEVGSAQAIDLALNSRGVELYEAAEGFVRDYNHSLGPVFIRIMLAIKTLGASEFVFIPLNSITAGIEASLDYRDKGGDKTLELFRVGIDKGGRHALNEAAWAGGFYVLGKCVKGAFILGKEVVNQFDLIKQAFKEIKWFSSTRQLPEWVARTLASGDATAKAAIRAHRGFDNAAVNIGYYVIDGGNTALSKAEALAQVEARIKVDEMAKLVTGGKLVKNGKELSRFQARALVAGLRRDKFAIELMNKLNGAEYESLNICYNKLIGELEKEVCEGAVKNLARRLGIPAHRIRYKTSSGNANADMAAGKKVARDLDVTFEYQKPNGEWKDVDYTIAQESFNAELYNTMAGVYGSKEAMAAFAEALDMTVTSALHPEAYSPEYNDLLVVVDPRRAGEAFKHPEIVAKVAKYKCTHWMGFAEEMAAAALKLKESVVELVVGSLEYKQYLSYLSKSAMFAEEAVRQFTKQADRIIVEKIAILERSGKLKEFLAGVSVDVTQFLKKLQLLKHSGAGRVGAPGLTITEANAILAKDYGGATVEQCFDELETLIVEMNKFF